MKKSSRFTYFVRSAAAVAFQEKQRLKSIHRYILEHWIDWFLALPSYEIFVTRLNRISSIFPSLVSCLLDDIDKIETGIPIILADSMPIITCSNKHKAKVALEMTDKGYCSTKGLHYFGVKLHYNVSPNLDRQDN